jgi:hypothetical protein
LIGVAKLLLNQDPMKAAWPNELKPRLLKELTNEILTIIFQTFINTGVMPNDLKIAQVVSIY